MKTMSGSSSSKTSDTHPEDENLTAPEKRWDALMRGQIISATTQKFFNYVWLADQKAQGLILLNTILIPVALNWIDKDVFHLSAIICIATAVISILCAIICIYPKRRNGRKPDGSINLLHFGDIGLMTEDEFLEEFRPVFNTPSKLADAAAKDIHDVARRIIKPKFFWLKASYILFFVGNMVATAFAVLALY
jgi:hypothetical protein